MSESNNERDLARNPPRWLRFIVGSLGSSVVVGPPFAVRLSAANLETANEVSVFASGTGVVIGGAWLLSIILTTVIKEDHILKCFLTSIGVPGLVVALTLGTQIIE